MVVTPADSSTSGSGGDSGINEPYAPFSTGLGDPTAMDTQADANSLAASPPPGSLDPNFGGGSGIVGVSGSESGSAGLVAVDSQGRAIVAGTAANGELELWRYASSGCGQQRFW